MKIEDGKTYLTENGYTVKMKKNSLPRYCFSCINENLRETWTEEGVAYHDDCGFNIIKEIKND